ncbi:MAG: UDP-2,3-diacylglucosamine diphosphatase LpxI [Deltaproteobacteria bacterium]|jgi:DUF1009 family protein|nr:UDP-2,3-diacylglucosamine diphosphatase LpxI [Deltaproteobacteria bacterium]
MSNIGIIAGSGQFPALVAQEAHKAGHCVFICGFKGHASPDLACLPELADRPDAFVMLPLGQLGGLIDFFKRNHVDKICMAGAIAKPKALDLRPDLRAAKLIFKLRRVAGDDFILRAFAAELAEEGLPVVQAADLAPSLRAPAGILTRRKPSEDDWEAIRCGWPIGRLLGRHDVGQSLVMRGRMVVAVEALEGTDAALRRGGDLGGKGCVALKMLKPGQDTRLDLPSIGLGTVEIMTGLGYSCLAYEAGHTLFFDLEAAIRLADRHDLTVIGLTPEDIAGLEPRGG